MAKVLGIGGIFFKAQDSEKLGQWYKRWLGVPVTPYGANFEPSGLPPHSLSVWTPFKKETTYFDPSKKDFMVNLIVDDVEEALVQVKMGGAQVLPERESGEFGRFGWFVDPEGNKVELWQPGPQPSPQ